MVPHNSQQSALLTYFGLLTEDQATRDATYFKAQMEKLTLMKDMFAQMKASNEKKAAKAAEDEAAGIVSTDPRSIKNTK